MLQSKSKWKLPENNNQELADRLSSDLAIPSLLAKLFIVRGIESKEQAEVFLKTENEMFHDPFLMHGMSETVSRIKEAVEVGEKIRIYGDYDADGVSSTTLMYFLLSKLGADFDYYIPDRFSEGYGLNLPAIQKAKDEGISLIITVDNGISAVEQIQYANELGLTVLVTDHHEPPDILPNAFAIINPKIPQCDYPFKQLAGVGVALKLAHALLGYIPDEFLEIASIGTVADLMPLTDENRLIVKQGIEKMKTTSFLGLRALLDVAEVDTSNLSSMHIGFALGPRINAGGRLLHAENVVKLLTASNEEEAQSLAYELDALNKERQSIVNDITAEAFTMIEESKGDSNNNVIVVANEGWNVGVIGIVASKILEKYYRPVLVLNIDKGTGLAKGSARSISGFNIFKALSDCSSLLDHFGGHEAAAGLTMQAAHISKLREQLNQLAGSWLSEDDFVPVIEADIESDLQDITIPIIEQIESTLAPFGAGNPSPNLILKDLRILKKNRLGKEKQHLKLVLSQGMKEVSCSMEAIGFGKGDLEQFISADAKVDVVGELSINEWNGMRKPQLFIKDIRIPNQQVFDWRNLHINKMVENLQQIKERGDHQIAIMLEDENGLKDFPEQMLNTKVMFCTMDANGELTDINHIASGINEVVSDLVLYSVPADIHRLKALFAQNQSFQRIYIVHKKKKNSALKGLPSRDAFKTIYASLLNKKNWDINDSLFLEKLCKRSSLSKDMIQFMIGVFEELNFIQKDGNSFRCIQSPKKNSLDSSSLYKQRWNQTEIEKIFEYSTTNEMTQWILNQT
ncbi:single-stranded-DNA-specific exonuclease RecJ [Chengkuizengella axinellae]|uniref:Single-stranded-DNA-specific exonuclease RecJ n=1 Tax=Chengkuizengella axinellae TaxID=3064388 RepID=A0ABT9ITY6_9BACL|nr:single-stranded-DNA-specific exonuclease RecJ [Chengkuizengella sp. 2205SS18-9]MDP5272773.1 single-stranded-DNA-specific exonuclease RecJ [Chengkuizengella sp. 2205SS18-9]